MIHRDDHKDNFTMIQNDLLNDTSISFEAKGFLVYLLSLPDFWEFSINGLSFSTGLGRTTIMRLVKELKKAGYLVQKRKQDKLGKIVACSWELYETPTVRVTHTMAKPTVWQNHSLEEPQCGKPAPITSTNNKQVLNKPSTKEKKSKEKKFVPPSLEEVEAYCQSRKSDVDPKKFFEYYQAGNWKDAKGNQVKNWKQKVITWEGRKKKTPKNTDENPFTALRREEGFI